MKTAIKNFAKFYIGKKEVTYQEFMSEVYKNGPRQNYDRPRFDKHKFYKHA